MFVDRVKISVEAGRGGNGCVSFRREKHVPNGGPDGGDGGDGGSIRVIARLGVDSLNAIAHRKHWHAQAGGHGRGGNCSGRAGEDLEIHVPPGTVVIDAATGDIIKDLKLEGDQVTAARGGHRGKGNARFKSSINQVPRESTPGDEGEARTLWLELKVIADVGLIGKPNAGKSTLLSRLSRARPEIADYPFTTKHPNLGRVQIDFDRSFIMADIPGLIEGAHAGVGLGDEFLRHVERAGILVHLIEPCPSDGADPIDNYQAIREELRQYDAALVERPQIVAVTKADLHEAGEVRDRLSLATGAPVLLISAVTGAGLNEMVQAITRALADLAPAGGSPR